MAGRCTAGSYNRMKKFFQDMGAKIYAWLETGMKERPLQTMLIWLFGGGLTVILAGLLVVGLVAAIVPTPAQRVPDKVLVKGYFSDDRSLFFEDGPRERLEEQLKSLEKQTGVRLIIASRYYGFNAEEKEDANALELMNLIKFGDHPPKKWLLLHMQQNYKRIVPSLVGDKDVL